MSPSVSLLLLLLILVASTTSDGSGGSWQFLQKSIGMPAMHMQLLSNDRVVIFDRTDFGHSNLSLPQGKCRQDPTERMVQTDCSAHSVEYDVPSNSFRPLTVQTDVWCSSGSAMPDGRLLQTGGFSDGERRVREFHPCTSTDACDWIEFDNSLAARRWYSTNHLLPDGRQIIVGGRRQFNYEFYPKNDAAPGVYSLPFLVQTNDPKVENNLYPFVFLNVDANLFIFANNRAILYNLTSHSVVKSYPVIPGGDPRSYPSTGSAVLLPLKLSMQPADVVQAEVLVCGGAPKGSYTSATKGNFVKALDTCARIKITDPDPDWVMEKMPKERVMGDMVSLPNGNVLIINGASSGTAGWEIGRDPVLNPVLYRPENPVGSRFEIKNPTTIPRMYHSSALLLRDGRVLVGGSNPHVYYNFTGVMFPTELSLEAFSPGYLDRSFDGKRPEILSPSSGVGVSYGKKFGIRFKVAAGTAENGVIVTMVAPPFTTHSFSMNQRVLVLGREKLTSMGSTNYQVTVSCPISRNLAPPGYYMLFVVNQEIPSTGIWVKLG
ncbi:Aldehyde oxidase GLOX1 [Linum grandiflorum]